MTARIIPFPVHRVGGRVVSMGNGFTVSAREWAGGRLGIYRVELRHDGVVLAHEMLGATSAGRLLGLAASVRLRDGVVSAGFWFADACDQATDAFPLRQPAE